MYQSSLVEDKTCRICGFVDTRNVNIFDPRWRNILYKILTIFPITLYATDPLPKNICKKCVSNVTAIFDECQKLLKVQKKWIDNVRSNQPNHPYVYILDLIERSNKDVIDSIKSVAPDFQYRAFRPLFELNNLSDHPENDNDRISKDDINQIFVSDQNNTTNYNSEHQKIKQKSLLNDTNRKSVSSDDIQDINGSLYEKTGPPDITKCDPLDVKIQEIKNKLQSNGCTLMSISESRGTYITKHNFECKTCRRKFPNQKFLAKHMVSHATIAVQKIFERKYLDRKVRRGRLIPVGDKKCIRCLNCWKVFGDNRGILDHWSNGECDFFCQICGKEYPNFPKMLREHVPAQHGISYRSSRRRSHNEESSRESSENRSSKTNKKKTSNSKVATVKIKKESIAAEDSLTKTTSLPKKKPRASHPSKNVVCNICHAAFPNFQSKNSHMRIHKNDVSIHAAHDSSNKNINSTVQCQEDLPDVPEVKKEPQDQYEIHIEIENENQEPQIKQEKLDGYEEYSPSIVPAPPPLYRKPSFTKENSYSPPQGSFQRNKPQNSFEPNGSESNKVPIDHVDYSKIYNCHPCGKKFSSKTELFEHKKKCQLNNKFSCRFCLRGFVTSADLQVHIMLMHRGS